MLSYYQALHAARLFAMNLPDKYSNTRIGGSIEIEFKIPRSKRASDRSENYEAQVRRTVARWLRAGEAMIRARYFFEYRLGLRYVSIKIRRRLKLPSRGMGDM